MCTECASRSIIAQLNPLSSPLMRWYGKLPSQNLQKPESTAPDDWQHRLLFICAPCKQKYRSVWQFDILASTVQTRNPTEFLQDVLCERCHWRHGMWHKACCRPSCRVLWWCIGDIVPVKGGASPMCLHFPCQCGQVLDESNEVVQVLTQSNWDNRNHYCFDVKIYSKLPPVAVIWAKFIIISD